MLTPNQILNHSFATTRGAYKADEVNDFIEEIVESYQQMFKENGEMLGKLEMLAKRIEEYRQDEDNIKAALITAQKMSDRIVSEARESADKTIQVAEAKAKDVLDKSRDEAERLVSSTKASTDKTLSEAESTANEVINAAKLLADNVISQAKDSSEEILGSVKGEIEMQQSILDELKMQSTNFKSELLEIYHANIESINEIPALMEQEYNLIKKNQSDAKIASKTDAETKSVEDTVDFVPDIEEHIEQATQEITYMSRIESNFDNATEDVDSGAYFATEINIETDEVDMPVMDSPTAIFDKVSDDTSYLTNNEITYDNVEEPIQNRSIKFGDDYNIDEDIDEQDEDDDDDKQGFKGFFKRKK